MRHHRNVAAVRDELYVCIAVAGVGRIGMPRCYLTENRCPHFWLGDGERDGLPWLQDDLGWPWNTGRRSPRQLRAKVLDNHAFFVERRH